MLSSGYNARYLKQTSAYSWFWYYSKKKKLLTGYSSLLEKKQKNPNIDLIKWKEIQTVSKLNNLSGIKILSEVSKVWRTQPA